MFFSSVSNSVSNPAFRALSAIRCLSCSSCASCRTWFAIWTYFPLGLNRSVRPTLSLGAPSNPLSAAADEVDAYGFALDSVEATGTGTGGGVGAFRTLAWNHECQLRRTTGTDDRTVFYLDRGEFRLHRLVSVLFGLGSGRCVIEQ